MHNLELVLKNETNKFLWDFEIQTDHPISARQTDLMLVKQKKKKQKKKQKEKKWRIVDFDVPADHRLKSEKTKRMIST